MYSVSLTYSGETTINCCGNGRSGEPTDFHSSLAPNEQRTK